MSDRIYTPSVWSAAAGVYKGQALIVRFRRPLRQPKLWLTVVVFDGRVNGGLQPLLQGLAVGAAQHEAGIGGLVLTQSLQPTSSSQAAQVPET